jgi:hypothetical protein
MSRLVIDPLYEAYAISQATSSRVAKRLRAEDKFYVDKLSVNSPLDLIVVLTASQVALGVLSVVLQGIGLRQNRNNRPENEVSFDRRELGNPEQGSREIVLADAGVQLTIPSFEGSFREKLQVHKATKHYDRTLKRVEESPVRVEEVTISYTREARRRGR